MQQDNGAPFTHFDIGHLVAVHRYAFLHVRSPQAEETLPL